MSGLSHTPLLDAKSTESTGLKADLITKSILNLLGKPKDLRKVGIYNVYGTRYRVNIFREISDNQIRITESFFVIAKPNGEIATSSPKIEKIY